MNKAFIFDMDGLLIDSEPFWRKAQQEVFKMVGIELADTDMRQTMGRRIDEVVEHWYSINPWEGESRKDIEARIIDRVIKLVQTEGAPMPGVMKTLDICRDTGASMAVASSSSRDIIDAVIKKLNIAEYFSEVFSAEHETHGKPHPAVFITTAEHLSVAPQNCVVFEDSPSGVLAAKAAKMICIAVPDEEHENHSFIQTADVILGSLEEFSLETINEV